MTPPPSPIIPIISLVASLSVLGCETSAGITSSDSSDVGNPERTAASSPLWEAAPAVGSSPLALAAAAAVSAAAPAPADGNGPLTVTRSRCDGAGCPLTFTFSHDMVKRSRLKRARPASIVFDPPQAGTWKWTSTNELVFTPNKGALHWGHSIDIRLDNATPLAGKKRSLAQPWVDSLRVPNFSVAGKWTSWPVIAGQPRFVAVLDRYNRQIGRGPLFFVFDQPVDPHAIARHIRAAAGNKSLKVAAWRPKSIARVWSEKGVDTRPIVAVRITGLPANGTKIAVEYPGQIKSKSDVELATVAYEVRKTIEVSGIELSKTTAGGRAPLWAGWNVGFNGNVSAGAVRSAITVSPEPESLSIYSYGESAHIRARLEPGKRYRVRVAKGMRDNLGNILRRARSRAFVAQDLVPRLDLPKSGLVLESARSRMPVLATNLADVRVRTEHITDIPKYIRSIANNPRSCAIGDETLAKRISKKTARNEQVNLSARLSVAKPGLTCVAVSASGIGSEKSGADLKASLLTQVTDVGITAKVHRSGIIAWVTRLSDAAPVADATVSLFGDDGVVISKSKTDRDGIARLDGKSATTRGTVKRSFVVAETRSDVALTQLGDNLVSQPWQFGLEGDVVSTEPLTAAVFTDRGVYRPEEKVNLKVIARRVGAGGTLLLPADKHVDVTVSDSRGNNVLTKKLKLDEYGTTDASVELGADAEVGKYTVRVAQGDRTAVHSFRVEEYRVPTFEVAVESDQSSWPIRKRARVSIAADYLHGGKLGARRVAYTVTREPAPLRPSRFPGFSFRVPHMAPPTGQIAAATAKLDGQGMLSFDFVPSHPAAAGPMRYVVDAHVTDVDRQAYAGRFSRVVHPSNIYLGVRRPARKVVDSGDSIDVPVIAIDPDGVATDGVSVTVSAHAIDYHTTARVSDSGIERRNRPVARKVTSCKLETATTARSCKLRLRKAGHYRITARAVDSHKRKVQAGFEITVGGDQQVAWPRFDHERIEILADKPGYKPGDVAKLAIQSPFATARGILTLERGDVLEHRAFEISNNTPIIDIPIDATHAPNIFASVVLLRGRVHNRADATGFETGAPAFRVGYTKLEVSPASAQLGVKVSLDRDIAAPGGKLGIDLDVRDASGRTVSGQATVMVVDEAVLGLTRFSTPNPIAQLYRSRALGVRTASSRLDLPHSRRARREPIFPGGGGGHRGNDDGRAGQSLSELGDLRNLFESTAYWNPKVTVDDGRARLDIDLPDNVTTFRVMAVVVDRGARAGNADAKVVVRKPVMVKPVLPRFAHPGDKIVVSARVFNGGTEPGKASVAAEFEGMRRGSKMPKAQIVKPGSSATFSFPIEVTGKRTAVVRFAAVIGNSRDAVEIELPILDPGTRRKTLETHTISGKHSIELSLPEDRIAGSTSLEITASSTSLSELRGAVDYVMGYPNGCIEQTTSRAYPLIVLEDLLPDMGVTVDQAKLEEYAKAGVKRLLSFQTSAGGLAYWPGSDKAHAFGTAFGLTALIEAKQRGYEVPDEALAEMAAYLEKQLESGKISEEMPHGGMADADTRALFVMTLGRLGRSRPADVSALWNKRDKLTGFGLSFLAVAVDEGHGDSSLLEPILEEIRQRAVQNDEEAYFEGKRDQGWSMGSPLRTHAAALLAFAGSKLGGKLSPKLLKGLIARQTHGMWGNTQENVFGIMAVAKAIERPTGKPPELKLALNGKAIADKSLSKLSKSTLRYEQPLADGSGAEVSVDSGRGTPTIVTVRAEYDVPLTKNTMKPIDSGFAVKRTYETLAGKSLEGSSIPLGDVIAVRVRVTANKSHNYVAISDRLPAGLEPLNTSLATTQKVARKVAGKAEARGLAVLSYSETRDSRVAFYADDLPAGTYELTYLARATNAGTFRRPAAQADAMYEPNTVGTSSIDKVVIK